MKPVRVRKARRSGRCPACGCWVAVGALIASVRGAAFVCVEHITRQATDARADELAALAALMTKPPTPGRVGQDDDAITKRRPP